jgi:ABC-2 type transport system permease protein
MNKTLLIARHEFAMTAANKAFVVITLLGPFIILALSVLPGLLAMSRAGASESVVAIVGGDEAARSALSAALTPANGRLAEARDEESARTAVAGGGLDAAIVLGPDWTESDSILLYARTGTDVVLYAAMERALGEVARRSRAEASGISPELAQRLLDTPELELRRVGADGAGKDRAAPEGDKGDRYLGILLAVIAFVMLLYMTVLLYGQLIGRSVLQEKSSKTVEIMLSSVSSRELMAGKILGPGLAGLIQYGFWVVMALAGSSFLGPKLGAGLATSVITLPNLGWLVVFFLCAYFLYASIYAALGAGAEDEQHLSQLAWPLLVFMMLPLVLINFFVMSPDSTVSVILSFFPLTSPIVMFIRVMVSPPAWWELAICVTILVASVALAAVLAAKVFRVGILMTGKKRKLGEILRWAAVK